MLRCLADASPRSEIPSGLCEGSVNRLVVAFAAYLLLAGLAWSTLADPRIRLMTLALLVLFAVKTWLHRKQYLRARDESDRSSGGPM
jgi:hypothetical protein